jgi:hypothetical protein
LLQLWKSLLGILIEWIVFLQEKNFL